MREINSSLLGAEQAEVHEEFVAELDNAIQDLETLTEQIRQLRRVVRLTA